MAGKGEGQPTRYAGGEGGGSTQRYAGRQEHGQGRASAWVANGIKAARWQGEGGGK